MKFLQAALALITAVTAVTSAPVPQDGHWVDTWTSMPQLTEYNNLPLPPFVSQACRMRRTAHC